MKADDIQDIPAQRERNAMPSPILRQIDLVNALTLLGLFLSLMVVVFAVQQQFHAAVICMMYTGIVDLFDGFFAKRVRRPDQAAAAGKEIDSLVDICAFGFAPAGVHHRPGRDQPAGLFDRSVLDGAPGRTFGRQDRPEHRPVPFAFAGRRAGH